MICGSFRPKGDSKYGVTALGLVFVPSAAYLRDASIALSARSQVREGGTLGGGMVDAPTLSAGGRDGFGDVSFGREWLRPGASGKGGWV